LLFLKLYIPVGGRMQAGGIRSRVLRKIFSPEREEVTEQWRILHNKESCDLYSAPNII
jgi:hypothetical protein